MLFASVFRPFKEDIALHLCCWVFG